VTTDGYDIYPVFHLPDGAIHEGFASLAQRLLKEKTIILDGYTGVFFETIRARLNAWFLDAGIRVSWHDVSQHLLPESEIDILVKPFLGGADPLFGTRASLGLSDFFNMQALEQIQPDPLACMNIIYGTGASLAGWQGFTVYLDLPKNELQYRARAGSVTNLGARQSTAPKQMYKRFYFVDWVVLNRFKESLSGAVGIIADCQRPGEVTWMEGKEFREALALISKSPFRVRPWFEPGAWGGQWIRNHIAGLATDVPNYAWSFEMIVPENGILLESRQRMLEVSFDWLMYRHAPEVLGNCHHRFGNEFPIRFDFLDTFAGGNLSIQCHPQERYIRQQFGENFTQQESYYILDAGENAMVNLGFREDINPDSFREALEQSALHKTPVNIPEFIQQHPSRKHDLFLIPDGTVHGSGINNLVLEISTTPYIFTFKMYDWLRLDLDGNPRDLNISRAWDNLDFNIRGEAVREEYISKPVLLERGGDWEKYHLPTHNRHYYDVWRYHFQSEIFFDTGNNCYVLSLVEGTEIVVKTSNGQSMVIHYAETFIIPAAAGTCFVTNSGKTPAILVASFIK
jgi:mannose-6-phosphate isomerase class I